MASDDPPETLHNGFRGSHATLLGHPVNLLFWIDFVRAHSEKYLIPAPHAGGDGVPNLVTARKTKLTRGSC